LPSIFESFFEHTTSTRRWATYRLPEDTTRTAEDPARRRCYICSVGRVAIIGGIGGRYLEEAKVVMNRPTNFSGGVAPYPLDPGNAARLWTLAEQLTAD